MSDSVEPCPERESLQPRVDDVDTKDKMHQSQMKIPLNPRILEIDRIEPYGGNNKLDKSQ